MEEKKSEAAEGSETVSKLECAICLQPSVQPVQLPCRHIFCYLCVKGATQQSKRCAMCRQEIPINYLDNPQLIAAEEPTVAFEGTYQWFYEGRNGWWRYDSRTSIEIENAYKNGDPQCEVLIAGFLYIIDFAKNIQYRRYEPYRRRRVKRDLVNIPIKGIAGIRIDDIEVSSSNDNEALCSSSSDSSSNASAQGKLAEFLKLKAEIYAELAEEEQSKQNNAPTSPCKKCKSVESSDVGTSSSQHLPMDLSMNSRMNGLPSGGHQAPGCSSWVDRSMVVHCDVNGSICHSGSGPIIIKPPTNIGAPITINNFFGPTIGRPNTMNFDPVAASTSGQNGPPSTGMGTYPHEPSNFGPARTGFCAGCSTGSNRNNVDSHLLAKGTSNASNAQDTTDNVQGTTKTTGHNQGFSPYHRH